MEYQKYVHPYLLEFHIQNQAFFSTFRDDKYFLLSITDDIAASRGVNVQRTQMLLFFAVSLMVAGIITVCGPIGFVGIMAPHICRLLIGPNHRFLIPASILFGASFLALCDTLARNISSTAEVPVGIVTAILGGPFFLWLLLSKNRLAS